MLNKAETGGVMGFIGPCQPPNRMRLGFDLEVRKPVVKSEPTVTTEKNGTGTQEPAIASLLEGVVDLHPTRGVVRVGPGQYVDRKTGVLLLGK